MVVAAHAVTSPQVPSLYAGVLGASWAQLPSLVRRLHEEGCATGRFAIRQGNSPLAVLASWIGQFPPPGEDVPTRLVVQQAGAVQRWERSFGGHPLVTEQRACEGGLLGERLGPVECVFQLRAVEDGIVYEQRRAWLCVGRWRLPLPRFLSPRIEAVTAAAPTGMRVQVKIGMAWGGWLLIYEGVVNPEEAPA